MAAPKEGSRDIGDGIIVCLTPDVCKTPVGSSLPPVPYSITAKQGDDANTVSTVRMTKKRAHNMASIVTKCTGDQPGSGTGIKSGTVGSVCHPKGNSSTVNIEGKPAIRHTDEWYMNNKNTIGKLTYVKSSETFDVTPAITLAQQPLLEAPPPPEDISPALAAMIRGIERAREDDGAEYVQYAEALPATRYDVPYRAPTVPNSFPNTTVTTPPGAPANSNIAPSNRISTPGVRMPSTGLARVAVAPLVYDLIGGTGTMEGLRALQTADRLLSSAGHGSDPFRTNILTEGAMMIDQQVVTRPDPSNGHATLISNWVQDLVTGDPAGSLASRMVQLENLGYDFSPYPNIQAALAERAAAAAEGASEPDDISNTESEITAANVRIVAVGNGGGGGGDPCDFHRHGDKDCPPNYPSHHIIQDMFFRVRGRNSAERPIGAPSLADGMSICLESDAHNELHTNVDRELARLGHTANLFELADISASELKRVLSRRDMNCDTEIDQALQEFKDGLGERGSELLGRSSNRPGTAAENVLRGNWGLPLGPGIQ